MVDWERVEADLGEAGYPGFEFDTGDDVVPDLSGQWLEGTIDRGEKLKRANLPYPWKFLDALPLVSAAPTDPEYAPERVLQIAEEHELDTVIISVGGDWVRIALVEPD